MEDMSSTENNHKTHSWMNTNVIISVTVTKLEMDPETKKRVETRSNSMVQVVRQSHRSKFWA